MRKYSIIPILATALCFYSCDNGEKKENKVELVKVKTVLVEKKEVNIPVRTSGILASENEIKLSFKTGGIIKNINVDDGDYVEAEKKLASLDLSEIKAKVNQAGLALNKAERDYQRVQNLYQDSVATLENLQNAETALNVAQSDYRVASFNLRHSEIRAPSKGTILRRLSEENEIVAAGQPIFLFASTGGKWIIKTGITDKDIIRISLGDTAWVHFDPYPQHKFPAKITEIGSSADPYTGTYKVELSLQETDKKLVNGFIAKVGIFPSVRKQFNVIPVDALVNANEYNGYVFIIEDGKHKRRKVNLGDIINGEIIVNKGIEEGAKIVVDGANYLQDDSIIEIINN